MIDFPTPLLFAKNFPDDYINDLFFIISTINSLITFYEIKVSPELKIDDNVFDILFNTFEYSFNIEIRRIMKEKDLEKKLNEYIEKKLKKLRKCLIKEYIFYLFF